MHHNETNQVHNMYQERNCLIISEKLILMFYFIDKFRKENNHIEIHFL